MPGALVLIARNGPPWAVFGLRSKVSLWLGPPSIHSTTQRLLRWPAWAVWLARIGSQPDSDAAPTPRADRLRKSRRDRPETFSDMVVLLLDGRAGRISDRGFGIGIGNPQSEIPVSGSAQIHWSS